MRRPFALAPFAALTFFAGCVCQGSKAPADLSSPADVGVAPAASSGASAEVAAAEAASAAADEVARAAASAEAEAAAASLEAARASCQKFRSETKRRVERLQARYRLTAAGPPATQAGFCEAGPKGVWRIALGKLDGFAEGPPVEEPDPGPEQAIDGLMYQLETRLVVSFTPPGGKAAQFKMPNRLSNYGRRLAPAPQLFDYDGDGVPELYVQIDEEGDEGHEARTRELLTYRDGAVGRYEPAARFKYETLRDVDGDGRPDLLLFSGYGDSLESCASGFPYDHAAPKFIARSLPDGTFTADDDGAKAAAGRWCPEPPVAIKSSYDAICARLWAATPAEVASARTLVRASCKVLDCDQEMGGVLPTPGTTADCARRRAWFEKSPPFTLP